MWRKGLEAHFVAAWFRRKLRLCLGHEMVTVAPPHSSRLQLSLCPQCEHYAVLLDGEVLSAWGGGRKTPEELMRLEELCRGNGAIPEADALANVVLAIARPR